MNRSLSAVFGTVLVALLGCGDDTSSGSGGSGSTSTGAGGDDTSTTTTTGTTTTTTAGGGGDDGVGGDPTGGGAGGAGQGGTGPGSGGAGGEASTAPCAGECAGDPGCDEVPVAPGEACQACLTTEVSAGFESECAVDGATGACCSSDAACGDFVNCLIGSGGDVQGCGAQNPDGAQKALACIADSCGDCGDGSTGGEGGGGQGGGGQGGGSAAPCADDCANDAGCDLMPADPGDACRLCIQGEVDQQLDSECVVEGAQGACCQEDADCPDFVQCVIIQAGTPAECAQTFPEGFARAEECIIASCGDCGMPM